MQHSLRKLFLLAAAITATATAWSMVIKGKVVDSDGEPVTGASIRLLHGHDSAYVMGTVTDSAGNFTLNDVATGRYLVQTQYLGYNDDYMRTRVRKADVTLEPIRLGSNTIMLGEVSVTGVKTPIKVMEDTIEYNADTYKTQPNAVVEDLLKRLPGVEVDSEGKITANGKEVTKILVDGKEFFSDDPKVASKNLPVNMVEKLQVVDRKSDLARLTGVDDGEDETVINLTVKKGMKNGYFGTIEGGYGTDKRYMGSFNVNKFWNDNQVTLLGNFNNINELGFTDSNGGRFRRFGGNNGINTSQALGVNFNVGKGEIFRIGGDVMYSHTDRKSIQTRNRETFFADSTSFTDSWSNKRDRGHNVRGDFRLEWKPDSFNVIDFRPNFSYNLNKSNSADSSLIMAGDPNRTRVSRTFNDSYSRGNSFEAGASLIYSHQFRNKPGRSFSVNLRYNHSNVREHSDDYSLSRFFLLNDSINLYDQYELNHTWSDMAQARLTWTEPLGNPKKGNFLTFAYRIQYRWNNADRLVYDHPVIYPGDPTMGTEPWIDYANMVFSDSLSNQFRNDYFNQDIRVGYKHVSATHNLDVGLSLVPQMMKSENLITDAKSIPTRWVWNYAPFLRYRLKMGKSRSLMLNYMGRSSQPSMTQLQPVADKSNPMNIVVGNPNLDPSFTHSLRLRFQDFNMAHQRSIMVMGDFSATQNSIVSKTMHDSQTGSQTTTYENVNGVWNGRLMAMISMPLRNKAWQISAHTFTMADQRIGFNNGERNRSTSFNVNLMPTIAFRPDNMEFELRPRYSIQHTMNTLENGGRNNANMTIHNYGGTFSAYYYTPIGVIINSDLTYTGTRGYSQGMDKNEWMWNASLSYEFLRDKSLTLSLKAYDLLNQRTSITRSVTANYIDDMSYNDLTRYFMVTVSWKFNTFGKGKEPASRNDYRGPGGHHGPPPGGGPRGGGRPPM
ncbi:MAG: TonB-dependent receptor family protein [Firmicutes bacterium]|nr:TonB-dependent receptor family protein [Bacillota bacterium]MCM1476548.1 TonB-dependent receptor family protein [Bacteroides sp.]